jgi:hypothetical protein
MCGSKELFNFILLYRLIIDACIFNIMLYVHQRNTPQSPPVCSLALHPLSWSYVHDRKPGPKRSSLYIFHLFIISAQSSPLPLLPGVFIIRQFRLH